MRPKTKKSPSEKLGLRKTDITHRRGFLSNPKINENLNIVNNPLGQARYISACYSCGSTENITTYHAAGGILGVCESCKNGGIV